MSPSPERPDTVALALRRAEAWPQATEDIVHLETHISHVYLVGDHAYKLKKPVDYGFLDFSTLEKRLAACQDEVRLNRRLAADIYLGVVPVFQTQDGFRAGAGEHASLGPIVDYLVQMRRLTQDGMLDRLAAAGRLGPGHLCDLAGQLAQFHAQAERGPAIDQYGNLDAIRAPMVQNFEQTRPYIGRVVKSAEHERLRTETESFLDRHAARFAARVQDRRIVDGHGDLHLRNMCLVNERVVIFDCIEFSAALRAGDVMNDIAFLTMDLEHRGLPALANRFLNEYLEQTGDFAGLPLLDFYQSYRAVVRAKVLCFQSDGQTGAARHAVEREAGAYFQLAQRFLEPRRPGLLITCGLSGSGKTTLARQTVELLNGVMVRSDAVRKQLAGIPLTVRGGQSGADIYTPAMTARTYAALVQHARDIIASGRWAILDAVYGKPEERAAVATLARELGVPFGILHCQAPPAELRRRLDQRAAENRDISDATVVILELQLQHFAPPAPEEGPQFTWTGKESPAAWLEALRAPPANEKRKRPIS